ncbi:MAG: DUF86 domain-containing protein [Nitrospirae bacterium]|nr:DUF86 domain-containing protein [Nitrospirota bacterium]
MLDRELIEKKLRRIEEFLREISLVKVNTLEDFDREIIVKRFIERNIELAVEQMVDICKHLVSSLDLREPQTYSECMDILKEAGIIENENIETYKSMIRFRNLLIHGYNGIDSSITYGIYRKRLDDFRSFIREVRSFLLKK